MEFLKKHYEKILLTIALLSLGLTAAWLPMAAGSARQDVESLTGAPSPKEFKAVDIAAYETALQKLQNPPSVDLSSSHLLFNPATWKQKPTGELIKLASSNPADELRIVNIEPLKFIVAFDRVSSAGYFFLVTKEVTARKRPVKPVSSYLKVNDKNQFFILREVKGPEDNPAEFVIELLDTKEVVSFTKDKPFVKVEGYAADLRYELENKNFLDRRKDDSLPFGDDTYKIIAITEKEVRVQANSNQKQTPIRWKTAP